MSQGTLAGLQLMAGMIFTIAGFGGYPIFFVTAGIWFVCGFISLGVMRETARETRKIRAMVALEEKTKTTEDSE